MTHLQPEYTKVRIYLDTNGLRLELVKSQITRCTQQNPPNQTMS